MAIGALKYANVKDSGNAREVAVVVPKGQWLTCNSGALTAQSAGELLSPATIAVATFSWVRIPTNVSKVLVRCRFGIGSAGTVTNPIVRIIGAYEVDYKVPDTGVIPNDGTVQFVNLGGATWATGLTLPCTLASCVKDTVYYYSDFSTITPTPTNGCDLIGVLVSTAANFATTETTAEMQLLFL